MIEIMPESTERMLAVKASGTLSDDDYNNVWIPALEKIIQNFDVANALLCMDEDFQGWDLKAMWDDAKFGMRHRNDFKRIAVVGGPTWVSWAIKMGEMLMDCEVKAFEADALQEALAWCDETPSCSCER